MIVRLFRSFRANAVAYIALFVALGGTGYAAMRIPPRSVGSRQLRNGAVTTKKIANKSITARKLDPATFGGSVRHWVEVSATGKLESGSKPLPRVAGNPAVGVYQLIWSAPSTGCVAIATPLASSSGASLGYANAGLGSPQQNSVNVYTYNPLGQPTPTAYSVAVIC
jgi:hypothetical protein